MFKKGNMHEQIFNILQFHAPIQYNRTIEAN